MLLQMTLYALIFLWINDFTINVIIVVDWRPNLGYFYLYLIPCTVTG